jgi:hypothetical protein
MPDLRVALKILSVSGEQLRAPQFFVFKPNSLLYAPFSYSLMFKLGLLTKYYFIQYQVRL